MEEEKNLYCIYCGKQVKGNHSCSHIVNNFSKDEPEFPNDEEETRKKANAKLETIETPANAGYRSSVDSVDPEFGFCEVCYQLRHVSLLKKTPVTVPFLTPDIQLPNKPTLLICTKCLKNAKEE